MSGTFRSEQFSGFQKTQKVRVGLRTNGTGAGAREDEQSDKLSCQVEGQDGDDEVQEEIHHRNHDVYHDVESHVNHHEECEKERVEDESSPRDDELIEGREISEW